MNNSILRTCRRLSIAFALPVSGLLATPLAAQDMETIDPDVMIDGDLYDAPAASADPAAIGTYEVAEPSARYEAAQPRIDLPPEAGEPAYASTTADDPWGGASNAGTVDTAPPPQTNAANTTYKEDDLIGAAEGLFGRGAEGLARLIQDILKDQGEPNAYIVGREGSGAFVVGVRYGSGTLFHAVEGNMPVYWTGPSIGFDAGANAGNTFVLVYNLHDTEELYERYPAGEGQAY